MTEWSAKGFNTFMQTFFIIVVVGLGVSFVLCGVNAEFALAIVIFLVGGIVAAANADKDSKK